MFAIIVVTFVESPRQRQILQKAPLARRKVKRSMAGCGLLLLFEERPHSVTVHDGRIGHMMNSVAALAVMIFMTVATTAVVAAVFQTED